MPTPRWSTRPTRSAVRSSRPDPASARRRTDTERAVADAATRTVREMGLGQYMTAADLAARFTEPGANGDGGIPQLRIVRSHPRRRGAGPHADAVAHAGPTLPDRLVHAGRRLRPGVTRRAPHRAGTTSCRTCPTHDAPRRVDLTVNYRTPSEIMELANRLLAAAAPEIPPTRSVRTTGVEPEFARVDDPVAEAAVRARDFVDPARDHRGHRTGRRATRRSPTRCATSAPSPTRPRRSTRPIGVFDAMDAKGLEFDHVVVVEPAELVAADRAGLRMLYVTLTRATQDLAVVHTPAPARGAARLTAASRRRRADVGQRGGRARRRPGATRRRRRAASGR